MFLAGGMLPKNSSADRQGQDRFIDVLGSSIRYRVVENIGPTLIMLHGFGGDLTDWEPLSERICCAKIISMDLVGFGLSDRPDITYDLETQRKFLIAFMDKMKISQAFLIGSSMGASLALWTASRSPGRVAGLVLFAPSAYPGSMHHHWPGDLIYRPGLLNSSMRAIVGNKLYEAVFPKSLGRQALDATASYTGAFTSGLAVVKQPVLLIWSKGDKRVPFKYSDKFRSLLPQTHFIEAPEKSGHNAAEHPNSEIVEGIRRLLAQAEIGENSDNVRNKLQTIYPH